MNEADLGAIRQLKDEWSTQGKRVILMARKIVDTNSIIPISSSSEFETDMMNQGRSGLTLVGMVALMDPPRKEIPEVIRTLRGAQIRISMVRGVMIPFFSY